MEDEYKVVCALSDGAAFEVTPNPSFKVTVYSLKANISQTVRPIHSMFGSGVEFPAELRFLP